MDRQRQEQIEECVRAAWQLPPEQRDAFLADHCSGDAGLRHEVLSRLNQQGAAEHPTVSMLVPGAVIGPYRIEGPLGKGGMGEVYRARDTRLGRPVALKFLSDAMVANLPVLERFRREAQAISTLNHPNVCMVYDIGEQDGRPYLVMELMEGQTLKERIAERPFSNGELLAVIIPILEALEAAHAAGIVHRDIKPANIFLTRQGLVKILDFGLAKSRGSNSADPPGMAESLTAPGTTVGTISYMSPEQARGGIVDARSDLFACGVVLYQMATGTLPFPGDSWAATVEAVLNRTPRPARELNRNLLPEIERAIDRALEKDPQARYQSAADMRAELLRSRRLLEAQSIPAAPPSRTGRRWVGMALAAGSAGLLLLTLAAWYLGERRRPVTLPSEYVQLTDFSDSASGPALSPDGRMVAFLRSPTSFLSGGPIYLKVLPDGQATLLTNDPSPKYGLVFTPDGSRVAYTARSREDSSWNTWTVPVSGGAPTRLMRNAAGLTWIGDGRILFSEIMSGTALHMGIVTSQESRAAERQIYFPDHQRAMAHYSLPSPDRKSIVAVEMDGTAAWLPCRLLPMEGGSKGRQVGPSGACVAAAWSPDGHWMYFNASVNGAMHLWRQRFPDGAAEQITSGPGEQEGLAVAPDGESLITSVGLRNTSVWFHDASGERPIPVEGSAADPKISPDGKRVYYLLRKNASSGSELWWTDRASGRSNAALPGVAMVDFDISQDGQMVAFSAGQRLDTQIFLAPLDGSAPPRQVLRGGDSVAFGAAGELIFRQLESRENHLARIKTDGTGLARVVETPIIEKKAVSPDGAWIVVGFGERSESPIAAVSLKDGATKAVCKTNCLASWSADGAYLYVMIKFDMTSSGLTLVLPVPPGGGLPDLPEGGFTARADEEMPGVRMIRQGRVAPGPDPETYAFVKFEFVGNLFRIPLH